MIDVLMIALQFAPVQTTGAFRSLEFVKRLPSLGIRPTVLTIDPEQASVIWGSKINPDLSTGLPKVVDIRFLREPRVLANETKAAQLWRMLTSFNDTFEFRFAPSLDAALAELSKEERRFAAVYASAPPFGSTMLGKRAAKALGLPYILDMRDAWAQWSPSPSISRLHYARKQRDEARVFAAADAIVGVTPELTNLFAASHPSLPRERFRTIPNGISGVADLPEAAEWCDDAATIDIGYVGNFYWTPPKRPSLRAPHRYLQYDPGTEDWSYRSPLPFFRAWAALDKLAPEIGNRFRFHHVGNTPDWLMSMAEEHGVANRCNNYGQLPRHGIADFLGRMTGLLGTSMKRIGGLDYCLASKSFEYLASGKPTLAFVCSGTQKRFFEEVGGAMILDPDDPWGAASQLQALAGRKRSFPIHKEPLMFYDHDGTARQMAALMYEVSGIQAGEGGPNAA